MAEQVVNFTISSPGIKGLNTESTVLSDPLWADELVNWVYNGLNELQARSGYKQIADTTFTDTVKSLYEYTDANGVTRLIAAAGTKIYSIDSHGNTTDITGTVTATDSNWQFATFNDKCIGYQEGHDPIELADNASTFAPASGTQYQGTLCNVSGGRIWTVKGNTLYYSDLLINDFGTGSAGSFDLDKYWPKGNDTATAVVEHNGFLIVFGEDSILVYSGAGDPATMTLQDTIAGVGCIARDSVVTAGGDLFFLSRIGVVSLGRVIQEKSLPSVEASRNIRKRLISVIGAETSFSNIKATNIAHLGMYAISFPASSKMYLLDTTVRDETGAHRILEWDIAPTALVYSTITNDLYFSNQTGKIQRLEGQLDDVPFTGSGGTQITCTYISNWTTLNADLQSSLKLPKAILLTAKSYADYVTIGIAYDYKQQFNTTTASNSFIVAPPQFGVSQFGVSTYSGLFTQQQSKVNTTGVGNIIRIKVTAKNPNKDFSIKQVSARLKIGRTI